MQDNNIKPLVEEDGTAEAAGTAKSFTDLWEKLPQETKQNLLRVFWELAKDVKNSDAAKKLFNKVLSIDAVKETFENEALTDKDKDALIRKLNIDADLLDGVDTVLECLVKVLDKAPWVAGLLWDLLEAPPLDEILLATGLMAADGPLPVGDTGALILSLVQMVLSFVPDKLIIGALVSMGIKINGVGFRAFKNIVIHKIIPEPKEAQELEAAFGVAEQPAELTESFAAQFKLYENLWD